MTQARRFLSALMVAVLVLTGHAMAQARGMASPTGEMVLCTGTGPITVLVDENGQPTGPAHICPECALTFFAPPGPPAGLPQPVLTDGERIIIPFQQSRATRHALRATARAPPVFL